MTNVGDVFDWLDIKTRTSEDTTAVDLWKFFVDLPPELDLASAAYYLKKEFKVNDTGVDDRNVKIYVFDPQAYDEDEDENDYYGSDFDPDYCEQCNDYHDYGDSSGYDEEDDGEEPSEFPLWD